MIKLGDRRSVFPVTIDISDGEKGKKRPITGTVVYVHPRGRYCIIEFEVGIREKVKLRESFKLVDGEVFQ